MFRPFERPKAEALGYLEASAPIRLTLVRAQSQFGCCVLPDQGEGDSGDDEAGAEAQPETDRAVVETEGQDVADGQADDPVADDLDDEAIAHRVIEYSSAKYKSELFRNRLSDLCGGIRTAWAWLWSIIQLLITVAVIWSTAKESIENAVYAWWAVGAYMLCWLTSIAFSLVCYFLTGRYPGEAAKSRKGLAEYLEQRKRRGVLLPSE